RPNKHPLGTVKPAQFSTDPILPSARSLLMARTPGYTLLLHGSHLQELCRPATPAASVPMVSFAWTPLPTDRVPAILPCAAGFTLLVVPICCWAAAGKTVKTRVSSSGRRG